jgi:transposase-like protein
VQRFTPLLADAAGPCGHLVGGRWRVDEPDLKVAGQWRYANRAVDQFGQVIDVLVATRRDAYAAHRFSERAIGATKITPVEVTTDRALVFSAVLAAPAPAAWAWHRPVRQQPLECDHGRLKRGCGRCVG